MADAAGKDSALFPRRWRRLGLLYVCVAVPLIAIRGAFIESPDEYLLAFVVTASGTFTTPALVVVWLAWRRSPPSQRRTWMCWFIGYLLIYATGFGIFIGLDTDLRFGNNLGPPFVVVVALTITLGNVDIVRRHSGGRAVSVDMLEGIMSVVVIVSPAALLWGASILRADASWYAVHAATSTIALASGFYWMTVLTVRVGPERTQREVFSIALMLVGLVNGVVQTAQGVSGFTLPGAPVLAAQGATMSFMLLVPLFSSAKERYGLSRLPPQAQVRGGELPVVLLLIGLPVLLIVTMAVNDREPWAPAFSLGVVTLLLVLAAMRQLLAVRETRRLYAQVEELSEERREMLSRVVERADEDRHRVVVQLHEQAITAYATFVSFIQATSRLGSGSTTHSLSHASERVQRDLAQQAESLRQLMMAVRPLGMKSPGVVNLEAVIRAYLGSLYGDARRPELEVSLDERLELDWITETVVLRILQEALRNVRHHSRARRVEVSVRAEDHTVTLRVTDDGVGFDPEQEAGRTGLDTMRSFAVFAEGALNIESAPNQGTTVTARLHLGEPVDPTPESTDQPGAVRLRLVGD